MYGGHDFYQDFMFAANVFFLAGKDEAEQPNGQRNNTADTEKGQSEQFAIFFDPACFAGVVVGGGARVHREDIVPVGGQFSNPCR